MNGQWKIYHGYKKLLDVPITSVKATRMNPLRYLWMSRTSLPKVQVQICDLQISASCFANNIAFAQGKIKIQAPPETMSQPQTWIHDLRTMVPTITGSNYSSSPSYVTTNANAPHRGSPVPVPGRRLQRLHVIHAKQKGSLKCHLSRAWETRGGTPRW